MFFDETPPGLARKDDIVLRLCSEFLTLDQTFIPLQERTWTLVQCATPEPPKPDSSLPVIRSLYRSQMEGDIFEFLSSLGYTFSFDVAKRGFHFVCSFVHITIYRPFKLTRPFLISTALPFEGDDGWIVEAKVECPQEQVAAYSQELLHFAHLIKNLVQLQPLSHTLLSDKIHYSK